MTRRHAAILALILLAATGLRFYGLANKGILGIDEGRYVLDSLSKRNELIVGAGLFEGKLAEMRGGPSFVLADYVHESFSKLSALPPFSPKLGFNYLTALVMLALGYTVSACNYVEAASGVAIVAITYGLVRRVQARESAAPLIAAGALAVSCYHLYFSRAAYPQCSSALCVMLAVLCHLRWRDTATAASLHYRWLFACGIWAGLSFWINYQSAGVLPLFIFVHLVASLWPESPPRGAGAFVIGGVYIAFGFAFVLVLAEACSYPMILLFRSQNLIYPHGTFFELLWPRFTGQASAPFNPKGLVLFPYFLGLFEGALAEECIVLLLGAALLYFLRDRTLTTEHRIVPRGFTYLVLPFLVPLVLFSVKTSQGARMFSYGLPFLAGMIGLAANTLWSGRGRFRTMRRLCVATLLIASVASTLWRLPEILSIRSAYPDALAEVQSSDDARVCAEWTAVLDAYRIQDGIDGGNVYTYIKRGEPLPSWFCSDWAGLYINRYPDRPVALSPDSKPEKVFFHTFGRTFLEVEAFPASGDPIDNIRWVRSLDLNRARALLLYKRPVFAR